MNKKFESENETDGFFKKFFYKVLKLFGVNAVILQTIVMACTVHDLTNR